MFLLAVSSIDRYRVLQNPLQVGRPTIFGHFRLNQFQFRWILNNLAFECVYQTRTNNYRICLAYSNYNWSASLCNT